MKADSIATDVPPVNEVNAFSPLTRREQIADYSGRVDKELKNNRPTSSGGNRNYV